MHLPQETTLKMRYPDPTANPKRLHMLGLRGRMKGWRSTGWGMVAERQPGQEQAGSPKGGWLMRMLGRQQHRGPRPAWQWRTECALP